MQVEESMNEQLFKAMVMQTIVSKIPHSMPSFDRTNLISTVEKHLGPMTLRIENIPWHIIIIDQIRVNRYIQDMSIQLGFSFENILCPPVKTCLNCEGGKGNYSQILNIYQWQRKNYICISLP